jgi:hypothetical protein
MSKKTPRPWLRCYGSRQATARCRFWWRERRSASALGAPEGCKLPARLRVLRIYAGGRFRQATKRHLPGVPAAFFIDSRFQTAVRAAAPRHFSRRESSPLTPQTKAPWGRPERDAAPSFVSWAPPNANPGATVASPPPAKGGCGFGRGKPLHPWSPDTQLQSKDSEYPCHSERSVAE